MSVDGNKVLNGAMAFEYKILTSVEIMEVFHISNYSHYKRDWN
jgi:hypothetical protein